MTVEELIKGGLPAPRQRFTMAYIIAGVVTTLVAIALYIFFTMVQEIQRDQKASEQRGYKNRAVICDMVKALGIKESKECHDPQVQKYRDPNSVVGSTTGARNSETTLIVVCALATKLDVKVAQCSAS